MTGWLVVWNIWNMAGLFSISYMGCHPSHLIFFRGVGIPPTRYRFVRIMYVYV